MTFGLSNQKKITIKTAIKKVFEKTVLFLFIFLIVFSVTNFFFNASIQQKSLDAATNQSASRNWTARKCTFVAHCIRY